MYFDDTIAAIATPRGPGGVGIVRVSGPSSQEIAAAVFTRRGDSAAWRSHRMYTGRVRDHDGTVVDHGLAVLMLRPRSYTGEDVLEIHCHGSPVVLQRVLDAVLASGARLACRGEFTKRAFLNGRLDLTQAEAVMDMVSARTSTEADLAVRRLSGHLSEYLQHLRADLIRIKALLEVQIDFSDEDVTVRSEDLLTAGERALAGMQRLLGSYRYGRLMREGARVAIVGKPNVGKSSLLNALLGTDRAIVTPHAGTTRDTIEESADFCGLPVVLTDTAGLRQPEAADAVERIGMERASSTAAAADLVLVVIDGSREMDADDVACVHTTNGCERVIVVNKVDLPLLVNSADLAELAGGAATVAVSARFLEGLDTLRQVVARQLGKTDGDPSLDAMLGNTRQRDALAKAKVSIDLACQSMRNHCPADIVAVDVQDSIEHLETITGQITAEDVLDEIFSHFCIGK
jgi:tRNA modification GTPase